MGLSGERQSWNDNHWEKNNKTKPKRTAVFFVIHWQLDRLSSQPVTMVVWGEGVAMSSKGRRWGLFLRWRRFSRRFRRLGSRGRLLEVEVLQCHVQGHDLNTAHGLEVSEIPQRAMTVVLVLGGGGRGVFVGKQRWQQQLRHKQAPVGPLGLTRLPLRLRQPRFAQPVGDIRGSYKSSYRDKVRRIEIKQDSLSRSKKPQY